MRNALEKKKTKNISERNPYLSFFFFIISKILEKSSILFLPLIRQASVAHVQFVFSFALLLNSLKQRLV